MNKNVTNFFLDILLPATLVVSTGVGTYLLTGGEEEYPPPEESEEILEKESSETTIQTTSTESRDIIIDDDNTGQGFQNALDELLTKVDQFQAAPPDWAVEVSV